MNGTINESGFNREVESACEGQVVHLQEWDIAGDLT